MSTIDNKLENITEEVDDLRKTVSVMAVMFTYLLSHYSDLLHHIQSNKPIHQLKNDYERVQGDKKWSELVKRLKNKNQSKIRRNIMNKPTIIDNKKQYQHQQHKQQQHKQHQKNHRNLGNRGNHRNRGNRRDHSDKKDHENSRNRRNNIL